MSWYHGFNPRRSSFLLAEEVESVLVEGGEVGDGGLNFPAPTFTENLISD